MERLHLLAFLQILPQLVSPAAPLQTPTIIVDPQHPVYFPGERLTLRCSAPDEEAVTSYQFYNQRGERVFTETTGLSGGPWLVLTAETGKAGAYSCEYWAVRDGRHIYSARSQPVPVPVMEPLLAPALSLSPQHPVYVWGERVTLECSAPGIQEVAGYRFYKRHRGRAPEELPAGATGPLEMLTVEVGDPSEYSCAYWVLRASREFPSPESPSMPVAVIAPLPAPQLTASPAHPVYVVGEAVALTCSIPGAPTLATVQFSKDGGELTSPLLSNSPTLQLASVGTGHAGTYSCRYQRWESGREISSPPSGTVAISVLVPPAAPQLSVFPSYPGYMPGDSVTLTCSAPRGHMLSRIQFLKDGQNLDSQAPGPDPLHHSHALRLPPPPPPAPSHSGAYSCRYWFLESGWEIPSRPSDAVHILVLDPPRKPSVSLSPDYPAYVTGDRVEINCSAPPGASLVQYGLYESGEPLGSLPGNPGIRWMDLEANNTRHLTWSFSCNYVELIQGRAVPSYASHPISISVFPAPDAPSLRLIPPLPLYVTGETVTAECVAPAGPYVPWAHWVLRDGEALGEQPGPQLTLNVTPSDSGTYRCGYSTELHGRHLRSPPSDLVPLSVTDPPPQPELSVDPPSRLVSEGLPLLIICMASGDTSERRFHFYKDGAESEISTMEPGTSSMNFSVLSILRASPSNTSEFSCGYEVNMSGRWIPSPRSQAVNVTVTAWSLPIPLVAGCGGAATALALLLLLLLLIPLCRKKAATRRLSTSYWKSQELRRSRIMRRSIDISGVNMGLQQMTKGGWPQAVSQDWGLLPKLPAEGPRPGRAAGGAVPLKGQKEEDDADSGAEFEFPDIDPTYSQLTFSCSTFRQHQELSASLEHVYSTPDL
ncbi:Fc receptor-like protein 5 [Pangshura tecta]